MKLTDERIGGWRLNYSNRQSIALKILGRKVLGRPSGTTLRTLWDREKVKTMTERADRSCQGRRHSMEPNQ